MTVDRSNLAARAPTGPTGTAVKRGRDHFRRFSIPLRVLARVFAALPARVRIFVWRAIEGWHGLLAAGLRYSLLRSLCAACGDNILVGPYVEIRNWSKLALGSNVSIHRDCYIDAIGGVRIGNDVSIAHASSILSFEHGWEDEDKAIRDNPVKLSPVVVENDVWIGCGCRVLAGVHLGSRSIIAAGAVVTKDVPPRTIAGGVPARPLKSI